MLVLLAAQDAGVGPCCGFAFVVAVIAFVMVVSKVGSATQNGFEQLRQSGTPALGIVLRIDALGQTIRGMATTFSGMTASGASAQIRNSIHQRNASIDVEIPGRPPYQVTGAVQMPLNMSEDILPGSSVELRVDPKNPNKIIIVGPGSGFAGFTQIPVTFQQDRST